MRAVAACLPSILDFGFWILDWRDLCQSASRTRDVGAPSAVPGAPVGAGMLKRTLRRVGRCEGLGAAWRPFFLPIDGAPSGRARG